MANVVSMNVLWIVRLNMTRDVFHIIEQPVRSKLFWPIVWDFFFDKVKSINISCWMGSNG